MTDFFCGKVCLVTGGTGTFGVNMADLLLNTLRVKKLRILARGEERMRQMAERFAAHIVPGGPLTFLVGDVRDIGRLRLALHGVDVVLHAAAMKQIPLCEYNPLEAVATNVMGTENVIRACLDNGVGRMLLISSDKAAGGPLNLYGATKMCAERLVMAANAYSGGRNPKPIFAAVRYGNVAGSTGSAVHVWRKQAADGQPLTITDADMTRFWWSARQAVEWTASVVENMEPGCVYVPIIPSVCMLDIARCVAQEAGEWIGIHPWYVETGIRPGEKLHEVLVSGEEMGMAELQNDRWCIRYDKAMRGPMAPYTSRDCERRLTGAEALRLCA